MTERPTPEHYIGECIIKCASIILSSRVHYSQSNASDKRGSKWFLLKVPDIADAAREIEPWRRDVSHPMIIEFYMQPWGARSAVPQPGGGSSTSEPGSHEMLVERWVLSYPPRAAGAHQPGRPSMDEAGLYKRLVIMVRSLFCYVRLLPAYRLFKAGKKPQNELKMYARISRGTANDARASSTRAAPASQPGAMRTFSFSPVEGPSGSLHVAVEYRPASAIHILEHTTSAATPPLIIPDYINHRHQAGPSHTSISLSAAPHWGLSSGPMHPQLSARSPPISSGAGILRAARPPLVPPVPLQRQSWSSREMNAGLPATSPQQRTGNLGLRMSRAGTFPAKLELHASAGGPGSVSSSRHEPQYSVHSSIKQAYGFASPPAPSSLENRALMSQPLLAQRTADSPAAVPTEKMGDAVTVSAAQNTTNFVAEVEAAERVGHAAAISAAQRGADTVSAAAECAADLAGTRVAEGSADSAATEVTADSPAALVPEIVADWTAVARAKGAANSAARDGTAPGVGAKSAADSLKMAVMVSKDGPAQHLGPSISLPTAFVEEPREEAGGVITCQEWHPSAPVPICAKGAGRTRSVHDLTIYNFTINNNNHPPAVAAVGSCPASRSRSVPRSYHRPTRGMLGQALEESGSAGKSILRSRTGSESSPPEKASLTDLDREDGAESALEQGPEDSVLGGMDIENPAGIGDNGEEAARPVNMMLSSSPQLPFAMTPSAGASLMALVEQQVLHGLPGCSPPLVTSPGGVSGRDISALATIRRPSWCSRSSSYDPLRGVGPEALTVSVSPLQELFDSSQLLGSTPRNLINFSPASPASQLTSITRFTQPLASLPSNVSSPLNYTSMSLGLHPSSGRFLPALSYHGLGTQGLPHESVFPPIIVEDSGSDVLPFAIDVEVPVVVPDLRASTASAYVSGSSVYPPGENPQLASLGPVGGTLSVGIYAGQEKNSAVEGFIRMMQDAPPLGALPVYGGAEVAMSQPLPPTAAVSELKLMSEKIRALLRGQDTTSLSVM